MAEIFEYFLVVMASSLFVVGSVATYGSFATFESQLQFRADAASVSGLVFEAIRNGTSSAALSFPASTISCESGNLVLASGSQTSETTLPLGCDFRMSLSPGQHTIAFAATSSYLSLRVG